MPLPAGTIPLTGPVIDVTGSLLTANTALRDAGAVSLRGGRLQRVNSAGSGWEDVPGHTVATAAPTTGNFVGRLWYDSTNNQLMAWDGSEFEPTGTVAREFARTNPVTFTGNVNPTITPTNVNNGRIWNYTGTDSPTVIFETPGAAIGVWRAMLAHTGSAGVVTIQAPAGTTIATVNAGESGLAIFVPNSWSFVFVGRNPTPVSQAEAEAGTVENVRSWTPQRVSQAIAALAPSGGVTFGSGSGEVATWAEGDNTDAFPLAKVDGAQDATQAAMRIRWSGTQAGLNAARFEAGSESIGNTRDGVGAPTAVALNEFLGIWIGTAEANILDITSRGSSVLGGVLFANVAAGEPLTVAGVAGTVFRTTAAVSVQTWALRVFRASLNPVHFGDVIDARIRGEIADDVIDLRPMMPLCRRSTGARPNIATLGTPTATESTTGGYQQWGTLPTGWDVTYSPPDETNTHAWGLIAYQKRTGDGWQDDFLFYVGLEDTYVAGGGTTPTTGMVRGDLIATTTGAFPTASTAWGGALAGPRWVRNTDPAPSDVVVVLANSLNLIIQPLATANVPADAFGIQFVAEIPDPNNAGEFVETGIPTIVPLSSYRNNNDDTRPVLLISGGERVVIVNQIRDAGVDGHGHFIRGGGTTLPAGLRLKAYWAVVRGAKGDRGDVTFGSSAGEVSPIAEGTNTSPWPFSKLPVGLEQDEAEVRLRWNTSTSWTAADVVVSTTGVDIDIPDAPVGAITLEFLVRIDTSAELRDILIDDQDRSVLFTTVAPTAFMLNNVLYQHYMTPVLEAATRTALAAGTMEVRLDANAHDQHIEYLTEEYLNENPVIESITLSDAALRTINSAGDAVNLSWPSALTQSGGGGDAQVDAMHEISIAEHATSVLTGAAANPENAFDGDPATSVTFSAGSNVIRGQVARLIYGGRIAFTVAPATSVTFSIEFWNGGISRGSISTGAITAAGEVGVNGPLNTWNRVIITATAFSGGAATLNGVRALDSGSTLPGPSFTQLSAEVSARQAADTALGVRIDELTAEPTGDESLLELVASTFPRDIVFTLGTRIPGGSDPGYNAGTHALNAAGSFSETGIPTDIVTLYRVTEADTVGGVALQNRLIVGIDEPAGSRRYQGERIRWGAGQTVRLTYLQRSLNNYNEYYSDVVTTLATAGQTVAFNVEDVQAEARDTIPYPRWIWHHAVATGGGTGLSTTQAGILSGFAYEAAGGTIVNATTLTAQELGDGRVGYRNEGLLGGISPGNILIYEISERTVGSTRELTLILGEEETGFSMGSVVIIDDTEYPFAMSASASGRTQITFITNPDSATAVIESGETYAIGFRRTNGSFIEFTGSTYEPPQVLFRSPQVVGFNLRNVPKDRFPDFLNFDEDAADTARDLKILVEERTPEETGAFDTTVIQLGTPGAANHVFTFHIIEHDFNNAVRQYDHANPDTSSLFPAGGVDFTNRLVLLIRDSLRGTRTPSNLLFWRGEEGTQQTLSLTLRTTVNTGAFASNPLGVYFTDAVPVLAVGDLVSVNVEFSDDSRLHPPNPEAFNERTLEKAGVQTWLGISSTPQEQQALDYDFISSQPYSQDITIAATPGVATYQNLQAVAVPQTPQIAQAVRVRLTFSQGSGQTGSARFYFRQGTNFYLLTDTDNQTIQLTGSGTIDLFLTEDYFDGSVFRLAVREPNSAALQFSYSATYDFYRSAESLKRSIVHTLINPGVQHTLTRNDFSVLPTAATQNMIAFVEPFRLSELEYLIFELSIVNANNAATERITFTVYGDAIRRQGTINIADSGELSSWHSVTGNLRTMIPGRFYPRPPQIEGVTTGKITEVRNNGIHNGQPIFLFAFRRGGAYISGIQTISWAPAGTDHRIAAATALLRR